MLKYLFIMSLQFIFLDFVQLKNTKHQFSHKIKTRSRSPPSAAPATPATPALVAAPAGGNSTNCKGKISSIKSGFDGPSKSVLHLDAGYNAVPVS